MHLIRIGTRATPLAQAQAYKVSAAILAAYPQMSPENVVIETFVTKGDISLDRALGDLGGKGLFTQEMEDALLRGEIDVAVHSGKDLPTRLPDGVGIGAVLPRESHLDIFLSRYKGGISGLPQSAKVGTVSLRRKAQILSARPDVEVVVLRGSVETRLRKLSQGLVDGTLLAKAGIERLHLDHERVAESYEFMSVERYLPAVAQGAIVMEVRSPDKIIDFLAPIHHHHTGKVLTAERAFLDVLDGSCRTPIGGYGEISGNTLKLTGQILSVDGKEQLKDSIEGTLDQAYDLGCALGRRMKREGSDILSSFRDN